MSKFKSGDLIRSSAGGLEDSIGLVIRGENHLIVTIFWLQFFKSNHQVNWPIQRELSIDLVLITSILRHNV